MKQYQQLDATIENGEDHMNDQYEKSLSHPSTCIIETKLENGM